MKAIYKITNKINGKFYLGSTKNVRKRKGTHFSSLKHNKHHCTPLQRAVNKYGVENFEFEILESCEECLIEEQIWLDNLDWSKCYNVSKFAGGGDNLSNHPNKDEIIVRLTKILNENRHKIKPRFKEENGNWKGGVSIKNCESCGREISGSNKSKCKGCYFKERDYSGDKNPFKGKFHSDKTKKLISDKLKEKGYVGSQEKSVIINSIKYKSISEAARILNVTPNTIINRIKNVKFPDYNYGIECLTTIEKTDLSET